MSEVWGRARANSLTAHVGGKHEVSHFYGTRVFQPSGLLTYKRSFTQ